MNLHSFALTAVLDATWRDQLYSWLVWFFTLLDYISTKTFANYMIFILVPVHC